jgi:hypothetical protein
MSFLFIETWRWITYIVLHKPSFNYLLENSTDIYGHQMLSTDYDCDQVKFSEKFYYAWMQ